MHLIVAAFTEEVAEITHGGHYDGPRPLGDALLYVPVGGAAAETAILLTGSGRVAAAAATVQAIDELRPKSVISTGFAGGTRDSLLTGNLVLATEVFQLEGAPFFWDRDRMNGPVIPDPALLSMARSAVEMAGVDFQMGTLVTLPTVAKTAGMKRWLGNKVGATAVDMESFAVGQAAEEAGVPFLAVRAIVDSLNMDLPDIVSQVGQTPTGNRLVPFLRHLSRHPHRLPQLVRIGSAARRARRSIASFHSYFAAELTRWDSASAVDGEAA
jgi:adenosylhomocysteine nucleosidase